MNQASDDNVRFDHAALRAMLDRIDRWTLHDVRDTFAARPAGQLGERLVPDFPGRVPPVLPSE